MRYFSDESAHGSSTSHGFANDRIVHVFSSKSARDNYVKNSNNISCVAIRADQATSCASNFSLTNNVEMKPKPFSGEYWGIVPIDKYGIYDREIEGCIGTLDVCAQDSKYERFYG